MVGCVTVTCQVGWTFWSLEKPTYDYSMYVKVLYFTYMHLQTQSPKRMWDYAREGRARKYKVMSSLDMSRQGEFGDPELALQNSWRDQIQWNKQREEGNYHRPHGKHVPSQLRPQSKQKQLTWAGIENLLPNRGFLLSGALIFVLGIHRLGPLVHIDHNQDGPMSALLKTSNLKKYLVG